MSGCCADKACTPETCMTLPQGVTCSDCRYDRRCNGLIGERDRGLCDWFPRRFVPVPATPQEEPAR